MIRKQILVFSLLCASFACAADRPNIIVVLTDDQGYADLGVQGILDDVRTPHLDRLANEGVRFTDGYVTAPICGPSRAGLLTGRYQQRMGVETNVDMPFELNTVPFPERLRQAGYRTGMTGKMHVPTKGAKGGENPRIWGFDEYAMRAGSFSTAPKRRLCTHDPEGNPLPDSRFLEIEGYRLDVTSDFAARFIDRNHDQPFFLYVSYLGPHTPLEATETYLSRFPDVTLPARRYGLAMISAIDDGVGRIMGKLKEYGIDENTLVIFLSDNGAPLRGKRDLPIDQLELNEWDGSLNDPLLAEKDMLGEGGIRVPYLLRWKGTVPPGQVVDTPVISLDIAATAMALNGLDATDLDGVNLIPLVTGEVATLDRSLYWMIGGQTAVRRGPWKLLQTAHHGPYLFDVSLPEPERVNRIAHYPEIAAMLQKELDQWKAGIGPRGMHRDVQINMERKRYNTHYGDVR